MARPGHTTPHAPVSETATSRVLAQVAAKRFARNDTRATSDPDPRGREVEPGYDPNRFPKPSVTTDVLMFMPEVQTRKLRVLLIERKGKPYKGYWAFPGGFLDMDEDLITCARRELHEETNLGDRDLARVSLHELGTYGSPERDPRDRVITVAYVALIDPKAMRRTTPTAGDDAADVKWFGVDARSRPPLAFDHARILDEALAWLRWHAMHTALLRTLLPARFPFSVLHTLAETVLGTTLHGPTLVRTLRRRGVLESLGVPPGKRRTHYRFGAIAAT